MIKLIATGIALVMLAAGSASTSAQVPSAQPEILRPVQTRGQNAVRVTVSATTAPIVALPDPTRTPLRLAKEGSILTVLATEGEWYRVEWEDSQWGRRVGYIEKRHVSVLLGPSQQSSDSTVRESSPNWTGPTEPVAAQPERSGVESHQQDGVKPVGRKPYSLADMFRDIGKNLSESAVQQREREQAQQYQIPNASPGTYRISVRKIGQNLYIDGTTKTVIETQLCLEIGSIWTSAILKWTGSSWGSGIYFPDSQTKCSVVALR